MRATTWFKSIAAATMAAFLVAGSAAYADREGKGSDRGGGGEGSGGRSASSGRDGGSRDGGSSRSFSGSSRSSSRSADVGRSDRGSSDRSRSFRSSDSDRSSRSIRSDSDSRSVRSFDSGRSGQSSQFRSDRSGQSSQFRSGQDGRQSLQFRSGQPDGRQYEARRPTSDNVKDFLGLPGGRDSDRGEVDRDRERNIVGRDRDRDFRDRDRDDRGDRDRWKDTWYGDKGDRDDHRAWSGRWRDSDRFDLADRIRRDWSDRRDREKIFGDDWWDRRHRGNYWTFWGDHSHRHNRPWYWWSWVTGPRLASWVVFSWPRPYYWDYGPGEYIYYDNGGIYVNGRWYQSAPVYYERTIRLIDEAPELTAESAAQLDWLPLGVFAVTPDGVTEPDVLVQLAVTRDGVIGGTAFDQRNGAAYHIVGMVDKQSQRAVWSYRDDRNKRIVMETSIYNLTQSESTGMVHYGPNDMRIIELVRLPEPSSGSQPGAQSPSTLPAPVK